MNYAAYEFKPIFDSKQFCAACGMLKGTAEEDPHDVLSIDGYCHCMDGWGQL